MKSPKKKPQKKNLSKKKPVRVAQGIEERPGIITEMCRLYRATRRGEVPAVDGLRMMKMMAEIRHTVESNAYEDRLAEVEARIKQLTGN